jgi:hypothetical protein
VTRNWGSAGVLKPAKRTHNLYKEQKVKKLGENYLRFFTIKKDEERKGKERRKRERERQTSTRGWLGVVTCQRDKQPSTIYL